MSLLVRDGFGWKENTQKKKKLVKISESDLMSDVWKNVEGI